MGSRTRRIGTRCTIGAAFALGIAGLVPATASSETGPDVSLPAVASPTDLVAAVESAVDDAAAATVVEDVVTAALDTAAPASPSATTPEQPDAAETGPATEPVAAPPPPEAPATPVDTTSESADTTSDTPATPPESAQRAEPRPSSPSPNGAAQNLASNVNVSVRIASPGDNGPVTQMNVAAASSIPAVSVSASSDEVSERSAAFETGRPATAVSPVGSTPISPAEAPEGTWTWDWDCLSISSFSGMSPGGLEGGITPQNWIWNWNCGGNVTQYQSGTTEQYRPINVNVGIRISSPGNDGPLTQANVIVAIGTGIAAASSPSSPPPTASTESTPVAAPAAEQPVEAGASEATMGSGSAVAITESALGVVALEPAEASVDPSNGVSRPRGLFPSLGATSIGVPRPMVPGLTGDAGLRALPTVAIRPWSTPGALRASGGRQAHASSERAAMKKVAPRWTGSRGIRGSITRQSSGTSVSPAGAGSSSSGGLPFILALPFLAAVLDMARRRALDRVATPSGHRSRVPDDPG